MTEYVYPGGELSLFARAANWKSYYGKMIRPFLGEQVLEVGAGLGATGLALCKPHHRRWLCLEPDGALFGQLQEQLQHGELPPFFQAIPGTIADLPPGEQVDTILYIDVLEHIEQDGAEVRQARERLRPGGFLVILAPAHPFLYSPFDRSIGHYRRYTRRSLSAAIPSGMECRLLRYLDSVGLFASLGNRLLLKQDAPSLKQILFWDRILVRGSRLVDRLLAYRLGKSVLGVWQKPLAASPG
jgi:SAM-dependent methyltransferase